MFQIICSIVFGTIIYIIEYYTSTTTKIDWIDGVFSTISAFTVTGLISAKFAEFTLASQIIILVCIQLGSTALMSIAPLIFRRVFLRRRFSREIVLMRSHKRVATFSNPASTSTMTVVSVASESIYKDDELSQDTDNTIGNLVEMYKKPMYGGSIHGIEGTKISGSAHRVIDSDGDHHGHSSHHATEITSIFKIPPHPYHSSDKECGVLSVGGHSRDGSVNQASFPPLYIPDQQIDESTTHTKDYASITTGSSSEKVKDHKLIPEFHPNGKNLNQDSAILTITSLEKQQMEHLTLKYDRKKHLYEFFIDYKASGIIITFVIGYILFFYLITFSSLCLFFKFTPDAVTALRAGEFDGTPVWWSIFHVISAFNNAGFSLLPANLMVMSDFPFVQTVIALLIVAGNTLFPVFLRLAFRIAHRISQCRTAKYRLRYKSQNRSTKKVLRVDNINLQEDYDDISAAAGRSSAGSTFSSACTGSMSLGIEMQDARVVSELPSAFVSQYISTKNEEDPAVKQKKREKKEEEKRGEKKGSLKQQQRRVDAKEKEGDVLKDNVEEMGLGFVVGEEEEEEKDPEIDNSNANGEYIFGSNGGTSSRQNTGRGRTSSVIPKLDKYDLKYRKCKERNDLYAWILKNARLCYTHLFPSVDTMFLLFAWITFTVAEMVSIFILNYNQPDQAYLSHLDRIFSFCFQSISTRSAGFNVIDLALLRYGVNVLYVAMMVVTPYPFISMLKRSMVDNTGSANNNVGAGAVAIISNGNNGLDQSNASSRRRSRDGLGGSGTNGHNGSTTSTNGTESATVLSVPSAAPRLLPSSTSPSSSAVVSLGGNSNNTSSLSQFKRLLKPSKKVFKEDDIPSTIRRALSLTSPVSSHGVFNSTSSHHSSSTAVDTQCVLQTNAFGSLTAVYTISGSNTRMPSRHASRVQSRRHSKYSSRKTSAAQSMQISRRGSIKIAREGADEEQLDGSATHHHSSHHTSHRHHYGSPSVSIDEITHQVERELRKHEEQGLKSGGKFPRRFDDGYENHMHSSKEGYYSSISSGKKNKCCSSKKHKVRNRQNSPGASVWQMFVDGIFSIIDKFIKGSLDRDVIILFLALIIICSIESSKMDNDQYNTPFRVMFEIASAYGNVGLSLGHPSCDVSFVGIMSSLSKIIIMCVCLLGRHRGLPQSVDSAISVSLLSRDAPSVINRHLETRKMAREVEELAADTRQRSVMKRMKEVVALPQFQRHLESGNSLPLIKRRVLEESEGWLEREETDGSERLHTTTRSWKPFSEQVIDHDVSPDTKERTVANGIFSGRRSSTGSGSSSSSRITSSVNSTESDGPILANHHGLTRHHNHGRCSGDTDLARMFDLEEKKVSSAAKSGGDKEMTHRELYSSVTSAGDFAGDFVGDDALQQQTSASLRSSRDVGRKSKEGRSRSKSKSKSLQKSESLGSIVSPSLTHSEVLTESHSIRWYGDYTKDPNAKPAHKQDTIGEISESDDIPDSWD
ncbi:Cation transporter like protein [Aduncisulcus paluster]|uniref:Cation transporter like protein n=1 Tax=Aduncisulcus paluster TaxID=2918883 RepID=A0ABQ5K6G1_9EUKA|nr:Cation transporter like protein [Aduncisulcus paluster]